MAAVVVVGRGLRRRLAPGNNRANCVAVYVVNYNLKRAWISKRLLYFPGCKT